MKRRFYLLLISILITVAMFTVSCGGDDITGVGRSSSGGNTGDNGNTGGNSGQTVAGAYPDYTYYRIRVPFGVDGDGYTNVSYMDTNTLKQLWFDQINRKAINDGRVFAIRNRENDADADNFQNKRNVRNRSIYDYYYFNENGDIVYKEDDTIIKKFMGAIITEYRDVTIARGDRANFGFNDNRQAIVGITWKQKGIYTIGAIYANTFTTDQAREKYASDYHGVYDFITYRHWVETFHNGISFANNYFERQYINPGFIEVLVMYDYYDKKDAGCAAVHSYYAYYGIYNYYKEYANHPGIYFTPQNMPYMTNENMYLGDRPEFTTKQLNHTAAFTDNHRGWRFMFMPGHKDVDTVGRKASTSKVPTQIPRW